MLKSSESNCQIPMFCIYKFYKAARILKNSAFLILTSLTKSNWLVILLYYWLVKKNATNDKVTIDKISKFIVQFNLVITNGVFYVLIN